MKIIRLLLSEDQRNFFELANERHIADTGHNSTVEDFIATILEAIFISNRLDIRVQWLNVPDEVEDWLQGCISKANFTANARPPSNF